jgi:hypothetical protein
VIWKGRHRNVLLLALKDGMMGGKTMSLGHFDSNLIGQYHALVAGGSAGQVNGRTLEFGPYRHFSIGDPDGFCFTTGTA